MRRAIPVPRWCYRRRPSGDDQTERRTRSKPAMHSTVSNKEERKSITRRILPCIIRDQRQSRNLFRLKTCKTPPDFLRVPGIILYAYTNTNHFRTPRVVYPPPETTRHHVKTEGHTKYNEGPVRGLSVRYVLASYSLGGEASQLTQLLFDFHSKLHMAKSQYKTHLSNDERRRNPQNDKKNVPAVKPSQKIEGTIPLRMIRAHFFALLLLPLVQLM